MYCDPTIRTTPRALVAVPGPAGKHPIPGRSHLSAKPGRFPPTPQCAARMEAYPCRSSPGRNWVGRISYQVQSHERTARDRNPRHADRAGCGRLSSDRFQLGRPTRVCGLGLLGRGGRARRAIRGAESMDIARESTTTRRMNGFHPHPASRLHPRTRYLLTL